jgi:REP element-mobilizing transposase RayT
MEAVCGNPSHQVDFITICTQGRVFLFGDVVDGEMRLNAAGAVAADSWQWLARQYDPVELDEWVVMPNHLHGILVNTDGGRGGSRTAPAVKAAAVTGSTGTAPTGLSRSGPSGPGPGVPNRSAP